MGQPITEELLDRSIDRLTGLADRDRFARSIDQADRDRDRMVVAAIAVDGLAEINQLCGYDAADDLLRSIGRALADRTSVDVVAGRTGPSGFAVLVTPADGRDPRSTIEPILGDLDRAAAGWAAERAALGVPSPVVPAIRAGVAAGDGSPTWADAEAALAACGPDGGEDRLLPFDLDHPGLDRLRRRQRVANDLADALQAERLPIEVVPVEPLQPGGTGWSRVRLVAPRTRSTDPDPLSADDLAVAPGLGGRLDHRVLDRAIAVQAGAGPDRRRSTADRIALPLLGPVLGPRSLLADPLLAWAGVVVEIDRARLHRLLADRGPGPVPLAERLHELSWEVAIEGFDGGWEAWCLTELVPIHHLRLDRDLVAAAAVAGSPAAATVATIVRMAAERGWPVVAPAGTIVGRSTDGRDLGLTHVDHEPRPVDAN